MPKPTFTIVPAHPGWFVVTPVYHEDEKAHPHLDPVIAWEIETTIIDCEQNEIIPRPILLNGVYFIDGYHGLVRPDGKVYRQEFDYDNVDDYIRAYEERIEARKAAKAAE